MKINKVRRFVLDMPVRDLVNWVVDELLSWPDDQLEELLNKDVKYDMPKTS